MAPREPFGERSASARSALAGQVGEVLLRERVVRSTRRARGRALPPSPPSGRGRIAAAPAPTRSPPPGPGAEASIGAAGAARASGSRVARLTPRPRQKASNSSSKRSASARLVANSALSASRRRSGRSASGLAMTRAASPVSAWPTAKPASRKCAHETGEAPAHRRARAERSSRRAPRSRRPPGEPRRHLGRHARAVLARLQHRDQRRVDDLGLRGEVADAEAGQRRGPIEALGDARRLAQLLLAQPRRPCARSAARRPASRPGWRSIRIAASRSTSGKSR